MAVSQSMEMEIKGLQSVINELHRKFELEQRPLKATSWKFPGKLAFEVDTDAEIQELNEMADLKEQRTLLLELLLDRLLLLLQVILYIGDSAGSASNKTSSPLTFTTAARKLVKATNKRQLDSKRKECGPKPTANNLLADTHSGKMESSHLLTADSSTQTKETSFTVCTKCSDKEESFVTIANSIGRLCFLVCGKSSLLESNWEELAGAGRFSDKRLLDTLSNDTTALSECYNRMDLARATQQNSIESQAEAISKLEYHCTVLSDSVRVLEEKLKVTEHKHQESLHEAKQKYFSQMNEVSQALHLEKTITESLKRDGEKLHRLEVELKRKLAEQSGLLTTLDASYKEAKENELNATSVSKELTIKLSNLKSELDEKQEELDRVCNEIDETRIELKKTRAQVTNLSKKCKSLQSGHTSLVDHIGELDQECYKLKEHLYLVKREKDGIEQQLAETRVKIEETQRELDSEKENRARDNQEKHNLLEKMDSLEEHLREVEKSKLLLMNYPYTDNIESLVNTEDHTHCVNANNVRILLLEEQNSELRKRSLSLLDEDKTFEVKHPVRLWQSPKHASQRDLSPCSNSDRSATSPVKMLRGRLGHLVDALSTAQSLAIQPDNLLQTLMCSKCDRMFTSHTELTAHACNETN